ncbi:MAG: hypothetical protein M9944_12880 [Rhizobiaceae bacterium]|nr:hypothetical protein [Rhizobiaceae bacterium]
MRPHETRNDTEDRTRRRVATLEAENTHLRARVAKLETALNEIISMLDVPKRGTRLPITLKIEDIALAALASTDDEKKTAT